VFDDLHMSGELGKHQYGFSLEPMTFDEGVEPVIVRNCRIESMTLGLRFGGIDDQHRPQLTGRAVVADNEFVKTIQALRVEGLIQDVVIAGNVFDDAQMSGIQIHGSVDETENILIANNTFTNCSTSMRILQTTPRGQNIWFVNNLTLGSSDFDWFYMVGEGTDENAPPGDGQAVVDVYHLEHNFREDDPDKPDIEGWIPLGETDRREPEAPILSRLPRSADYLRPAPDSPLANAGLGEDDLPGYVGAVPPAGVDRWDWSLPGHMATEE
jgi:hypothetical protein